MAKTNERKGVINEFKQAIINHVIVINSSNIFFCNTAEKIWRERDLDEINGGAGTGDAPANGGLKIGGLGPHRWLQEFHHS